MMLLVDKHGIPCLPRGCTIESSANIAVGHLEHFWCVPDVLRIG
jgi:hypothetical protein